LLIGLPLVSVILYLLVIGWQVQDLWGRLSRLEATFQQDPSAWLKPAALAGLTDDLTSINATVRLLRLELTPFLWLGQALDGVPGIGPTLSAASPLADIAVAGVGAAQASLEALTPLLALWERPRSPGDPPLIEAALPLLSQASPSLADAGRRLTAVREVRRQIQRDRLIPPMARLVDRLDKGLALAETALALAAQAPRLLGAERPQTYLLLAQNNDELRATGGFITSIGVVTLDKGRIAQLDMMDSYSADNWNVPKPASPEPMARHMGILLWVTRDTNWSPDFPTSARAAADLYGRDHNVAVDGVIALDQTAVQLLVAAIGPLQVAGDPQPVTGDNVLIKMRQSWSETLQNSVQAAIYHRKDFIKEVALAMRQRLENDPASLRLPDLGRALYQMLTEKHLLVYLADPTAQAALSRGGWANALTPTADDTLLVLDTNMGYNKANLYTDKSIDYRVRLNRGNLSQAEAIITWTNRSPRLLPTCILDKNPAIYTEKGSYDDLTQRCYWNYLRLYVPRGSLLVLCEDAPDQRLDSSDPTLPYTVFSEYLTVATGETRSTRFRYWLPTSVVHQDDGWTYRLHLIKQPGTGAFPVRVTVTLPADARLLATEPGPASVTGNSVTFTSRLQTDLTFSVRYH